MSVIAGSKRHTLPFEGGKRHMQWTASLYWSAAVYQSALSVPPHSERPVLRVARVGPRGRFDEGSLPELDAHVKGRLSAAATPSR